MPRLLLPVRSPSPSPTPTDAMDEGVGGEGGSGAVGADAGSDSSDHAPPNGSPPPVAAVAGVALPVASHADSALMLWPFNIASLLREGGATGPQPSPLEQLAARLTQRTAGAQTQPAAPAPSAALSAAWSLLPHPQPDACWQSALSSILQLLDDARSRHSARARRTVALAAYAARPTRPLDDLPLVTDYVRTQLPVLWRATFPHGNVAALTSNDATGHSDSPANPAASAAVPTPADDSELRALADLWQVGHEHHGQMLDWLVCRVQEHADDAAAEAVEAQSNRSTARRSQASSTPPPCAALECVNLMLEVAAAEQLAEYSDSLVTLLQLLVIMPVDAMSDRCIRLLARVAIHANQAQLLAPASAAASASSRSRDNALATEAASAMAAAAVSSAAAALSTTVTAVPVLSDSASPPFDALPHLRLLSPLLTLLSQQVKSSPRQQHCSIAQRTALFGLVQLLEGAVQLRSHPSFTTTSALHSLEQVIVGMLSPRLPLPMRRVLYKMLLAIPQPAPPMLDIASSALRSCVGAGAGASHAGRGGAIPALPAFAWGNLLAIDPVPPVTEGYRTAAEQAIAQSQEGRTRIKQDVVALLRLVAGWMEPLASSTAATEAAALIPSPSLSLSIPPSLAPMRRSLQSFTSLLFDPQAVARMLCLSTVPVQTTKKKKKSAAATAAASSQPLQREKVLMVTVAAFLAPIYEFYADALTECRSATAAASASSSTADSAPPFAASGGGSAAPPSASAVFIDSILEPLQRAPLGLLHPNRLLPSLPCCVGESSGRSAARSSTTDGDGEGEGVGSPREQKKLLANDRDFALASLGCVALEGASLMHLIVAASRKTNSKKKGAAAAAAPAAPLARTRIVSPLSWQSSLRFLQDLTASVQRMNSHLWHPPPPHQQHLITHPPTWTSLVAADRLLQRLLEAVAQMGPRAGQSQGAPSDPEAGRRDVDLPAVFGTCLQLLSALLKCFDVDLESGTLERPLPHALPTRPFTATMAEQPEEQGAGATPMDIDGHASSAGDGSAAANAAQATAAAAAAAARFRRAAHIRVARSSSAPCFPLQPFDVGLHFHAQPWVDSLRLSQPRSLGTMLATYHSENTYERTWVPKIRCQLLTLLKACWNKSMAVEPKEMALERMLRPLEPILLPGATSTTPASTDALHSSLSLHLSAFMWREMEAEIQQPTRARAVRAQLEVAYIDVLHAVVPVPPAAEHAGALLVPAVAPNALAALSQHERMPVSDLALLQPDGCTLLLHMVQRGLDAWDLEQMTVRWNEFRLARLPWIAPLSQSDDGGGVAVVASSPSAPSDEGTALGACASLLQSSLDSIDRALSKYALATQSFTAAASPSSRRLSASGSALKLLQPSKKRRTLDDLFQVQTAHEDASNSDDDAENAEGEDEGGQADGAGATSRQPSPFADPRYAGADLDDPAAEADHAFYTSQEEARRNDPVKLFDSATDTPFACVRLVLATVLPRVLGHSIRDGRARSLALHAILDAADAFTLRNEARARQEAARAEEEARAERAKQAQTQRQLAAARTIVRGEASARKQQVLLARSLSVGNAGDASAGAAQPLSADAREAMDAAASPSPSPSPAVNAAPSTPNLLHCADQLVGDSFRDASAIALLMHDIMQSPSWSSVLAMLSVSASRRSKRSLSSSSSVAAASPPTVPSPGRAKEVLAAVQRLLHLCMDAISKSVENLVMLHLLRDKRMGETEGAATGAPVPRCLQQLHVALPPLIHYHLCYPDDSRDRFTRMLVSCKQLLELMEPSLFDSNRDLAPLPPPLSSADAATPPIPLRSLLRSLAELLDPHWSAPAAGGKQLTTPGRKRRSSPLKQGRSGGGGGGAAAPGSGSSTRSAPLAMVSPPRRRRALSGSGSGGVGGGGSGSSRSVRTPRRRSSGAGGRASMPLYSPNSVVNRMLQEDREAQRSGDAHIDLIDFLVDDEEQEEDEEQAKQIAEAIDTIRNRKRHADGAAGAGEWP